MKKIDFIFQVVKFCIVGFLAFLIDFGILLFLTEFVGVHYLISAALAFSISVIFNYIVSMRVVFESKPDIDKKKEFAIFFLISLIGLIINQLGLYFFVDKCSVFYVYAKLLVTFIVMVWNFIMKKLFLENK